MIQAAKNHLASSISHHPLQESIDACVACAQACEECTSACLHEKDLNHLADCIRLTNDCAQACWAAAAYMSRDSAFIDGACEIALKSCELCALECAKHEHEHCQITAELCRNCAAECRRIVGG